MTLKLSGRYHVFSFGIMEDIIVKVGNFIFLVYYRVLDIEEEVDVP